jgi:hypothetical protein
MPANDHVDALIDDYLHSLLSREEAHRVEQHCAVCPHCHRALDQGRQRLRLLHSLPPAEASGELVESTIDHVENHERSQRRRSRWLVSGVAIGLAASVLLLLGLNLYYQQLSASGYDLVVLGQSQLFPSSTGALRIRLIDRTTSRPMPNIPVKVQMRRPRDGHPTGETVQLASLTTDANGAGNPRIEVPDWDGDCLLLVSADVAGSPEVIAQRVQLKRSWKLMLSSDKPVYQPGQTIHLRSLALRRPDLLPVQKQPVVFTVADPKGNIIFKKQDSTSDFGISAADCELASEITEGAYTIVSRLGDTESKLTVDVKKYVLPKFKIDLRTDRPYYAPGDHLQLTAQADYFFGKPVAGGVVSVSLTTVAGPTSTTTVFSGVTDPQGKTIIKGIPIPRTLVGRPQDGGDATVSLVVTVTDPAKQSITRVVERTVTTRPVRITLVPEAGTLVPNVSNTVYALVNRVDGTPLAKMPIVLTVDGQEQAQQTDEHGAATFELTPSNHAVTGTVRVNDHGGTLIAQQPFRFEMNLVAGDFLLRTDRVAYQAGQTMTLTARGGGNEPVFFDLIKDGQTILTDTIDLTGGSGERVIDLPADLFGTVQLVAYRFQGNDMPRRQKRVIYIQPPEGLKITASFDQPEYRPGRSAHLNLALTDSKGQPRPGAISLSAVDEAVYAVLAQKPGMEGVFYNLEQDLLAPVYAIYPWDPNPAHGADRFDRALFARTAGREGVKGFDVRPAVIHSLAHSSFPDKVQSVERTRASRLKLVRVGWVVVLMATFLSLYAGLWYFLPTRQVLLMHGVAVLFIPVLGIAFIAFMGLQPGAEFAGVKLSRSMATSEAMPMMAPAGGARPLAGPDGGGEPTPRVREFFPETLLWQPQLITDADGKAKLSIDLADSITTWRLSASAVAADGRLGAVQLPLKVFQPFFVDLNLPVSLTRGDSVSVPVVVYNYLDKPQTVTLKLETGTWFNLEGDTERKLDLKPNEVRSLRYPIRVQEVGEHTLQVTALGSGVGDAIKRTIEVVPDGRRIEVAHSGMLDQPAVVNLDMPATAIAGSARAIVKIYPSVFSQLVEGLENIFQMPSGCFEQTSSTTYPNVLALDYLKRTGQSVPKVEATARQYIHLGYQRLLGFEVPGGGFEWFGRPPAHLRLTAYGLMEFEDMARVHDVDPRLIERTRAWLLSKRKPDGSWPPEERVLHDDVASGRGEKIAGLSATAYIAWAVFGGGKASPQALPTRQYLERQSPAEIGDPHILALVANALLALDPKGKSAEPWLERLAALKQTEADGKLVYWGQSAEARTTFYGGGVSGRVETTALAALALLTSGQHGGTARQALACLVAHKDPRGTWYSTQATVLALRALLAGTQPSSGEGDRKIEIQLGDHRQAIDIPADQAEVMKMIDLSKHLKPGVQQLTLRETTSTSAGYQVTFRYHVPDAAPRPEKEGPLAIELKYDRTELEVDGTVRATARVENRLGAAAPMVMLDLPVPAGFAVEDDDFSGLVKAGTIARYQVRPRQVIVYLRGLAPGQPLQLSYRLKATMPVQVSTPGARVYEYYDPQNEGRSPGQKFTVK